jgi:hypothetical protein
MLTKEKIHELVDHMPDNFSTEDLIGEIILLQKIEIARKQIADGESEDWEDVKREMDSW